MKKDFGRNLRFFVVLSFLAIPLILGFLFWVPFDHSFADFLLRIVEKKSLPFTRSKRECVKKRPEKLEVIGCGWPRTGTISTKSALEILGYKIYHQLDGLKLDHFDYLLNSTIDPENNLDKLLEEVLCQGFDGIIDFPMSLFCVEMAEKFADAKLLLTVRDSASEWFESFRVIHNHLIAPFLLNTFPFSLIGNPKFYEYQKAKYDRSGTSFEVKIAESVFPWVNYADSIVLDEEEAKSGYLKNIEKLNRMFSSEKLLIFNVKEGWEPLCKFLGIDEIPNVPFPNANERIGLEKLGLILRLIGKFYPFLLLFVGVVGFFLVKLVVRFLLENILRKKLHKDE